MAVSRELVLYYNPDRADNKSTLVKGVLVSMGVRIRNIAPEQTNQKIGYLIGNKEFGEEERGETYAVEEEMMVLHNFTDSRLDELLSRLRRAGVPKIKLKAVVTEHNLSWTFRHLYEELKDEHKKLSGMETKPS